jgi:hypothetical protein
MNGHAPVWPESDAVSDGQWVSLFQGEKRVFHCNASYAVTNFMMVDKLSAHGTRDG